MKAEFLQQNESFVCNHCNNEDCLPRLQARSCSCQVPENEADNARIVRGMAMLNHMLSCSNEKRERKTLPFHA